MNQAAINAIRAVGATSQYIFVEGNAWSGAWTWVATNTNLVALTDPENKIVYEMHQYLDSDGSGTSATCVNNTIGYDRVISATQWLQQNGKVGIIGEFAGGANSVCLEAVVGMLNYLKANSNVWLGAIWWGGGPVSILSLRKDLSRYFHSQKQMLTPNLLVVGILYILLRATVRCRL